MSMKMRKIGPVDPEVARRFDEYVERQNLIHDRLKEMLERMTNRFLIAEGCLMDIIEINDRLMMSHYAEAGLDAIRLPDPTAPPIPRDKGQYQ